MNPNTRTVSHSPISLTYWDRLKGLSDTVKIELVSLLSTSLLNKADADVPVLGDEDRKRDLLSMAGCWGDCTEDAATMKTAILDGRKNEFMREINLDD